ncbi:Hypothetical protein CINCED_3A001092 [Cinara cedri]|uniref:Uncharacterized protein n=1 Tax=Cinara cedri TaxID=506608 RepID=A0A5E4MKB9_9HEMI|nr:Hypothetical protein CINCED_3A001092 [Cinara cedri]
MIKLIFDDLAMSSSLIAEKITNCHYTHDCYHKRNRCFDKHGPQINKCSVDGMFIMLSLDGAELDPWRTESERIDDYNNNVYFCFFV